MIQIVNAALHWSLASLLGGGGGWLVGWLVAGPLAQFINLDCIGHSRPRPFPILVGGAFMKPQLAVVQR